MRSERMAFRGSLGHELAARLDSPDGPAREIALFAHCFTCGKDVLAASRIAEALIGHGIAVLRFDFTGLGSSAGEFANTSFSSNVGDLLAAVDHLRRTRAAPRLLIGHSLGGAAMLAAAGEVPEARAVATIGAPYDPAHVAHLFKDRLATIEAAGSAEVQLAGRSFKISRQFVDDLREQDQKARIAGLRRALLVFHSPTDAVVGIENASLIFAAARHPKSFISLDDADHLLSRQADAAYVADLLVAWASRYLGSGADQAGEAGPPPPAAVVVEETGVGRLQQRVTAGPHVLLADEPLEAGGTGTGPSPYDLLSAALGACTSMTLRLYADRKGWPLEKVAVAVRHGKIHAADCADCQTREGRIDLIERDLTLHGPLSADQRTRLLEIADKCPVHRTLHSEVKVVTNET